MAVNFKEGNSVFSGLYFMDAGMPAEFSMHDMENSLPQEGDKNDQPNR